MTAATAPAPADARRAALTAWLATLPRDLDARIETLRPASADASFRRYFRLDAAGGTLIAMDAPPAQEDSRPYVHVAGLLHAAGLNAPHSDSHTSVPPRRTKSASARSVASLVTITCVIKSTFSPSSTSRCSSSTTR